jgi:hypothetical protein
MTKQDLWIQIGQESLAVVHRLLSPRAAATFKREMRKALAAIRKEQTSVSVIKKLLDESSETRRWTKARITAISTPQKNKQHQNARLCVKQRTLQHGCTRRLRWGRGGGSNLSYGCLVIRRGGYLSGAPYRKSLRISSRQEKRLSLPCVSSLVPTGSRLATRSRATFIPRTVGNF